MILEIRMKIIILNWQSYTDYYWLKVIPLQNVVNH